MRVSRVPISTLVLWFCEGLGGRCLSTAPPSIWCVLNEINDRTAFHGWQNFPVGWKLRSTSPLLSLRWTFRVPSRIDCGLTPAV
jgi:hypothetical protein